ncbi:MAG: N-acetylmuramoyl-L-alanine amidase [Bacilli bacterium]
MITHRRGHNFLSKGAKHFIDEVEEAEKVNKAINKYMDILNIKHKDVTPENMSSSSDLAYGVKKANDLKSTLFFSIHFNSSTPTQKNVGCEVWTYNNKNMSEAINVCSALSRLGFKNRGVKTNESFYELRNTISKAMIIEICFVSSQTDVDLYKKVGSDVIGRTIVEAITNKKIPYETKKGVYRVITDSFSNKDNAIKKQNELRKLGIESFLEFKEI